MNRYYLLLIFFLFSCQHQPQIIKQDPPMPKTAISKKIASTSPKKQSFQSFQPKKKTLKKEVQEHVLESELKRIDALKINDLNEFLEVEKKSKQKDRYALALFKKILYLLHIKEQADQELAQLDQIQYELSNTVQSYLSQQLKSLKPSRPIQDQHQMQSVLVMLPLSGEFENLGLKIKSAFEAIQAHIQEFELIFVDTQGDKDEAVYQLDQIIKEKEVLAIIGPMGHLEAETVAHRAIYREIPMLYFSSHPHLAAQNSYVFRHRIDQVKASILMGKYACEQGFQRIALVGPRESKNALDRFEEEFKKCNGMIDKRVSYQNLSTEVDRVSKELVGRFPLPKEDAHPYWQNLNRKKKDPAFFYPPKIEYSALFTTEKGYQLAQLVSHLSYWDMSFWGVNSQIPIQYQTTPVRLLGGLGFELAAFGIVAPEQFEKSLFVGLIESNTPKKEYWQSLLMKNKVKVDEQVWNALDLIDLLQNAMKSERNINRVRLRQILLNDFEYMGVRGKMIMESDGNLSAPLGIFSKENGVKVLVY